MPTEEELALARVIAGIEAEYSLLIRKTMNVPASLGKSPELVLAQAILRKYALIERMREVDQERGLTPDDR